MKPQSQKMLKQKTRPHGRTETRKIWRPTCKIAGLFESVAHKSMAIFVFQLILYNITRYYFK